MNKAKTLTGDSLLLTLGGFLAFCAERMITFTIGFLIIYETHSAALYSAYMLTSTFPTLIVPIIAGPFLDRYSKKYIICILNILFLGIYLFLAGIFAGKKNLSFAVLLLIFTILGIIKNLYEIVHETFFAVLLETESYQKGYAILNILDMLTYCMIPVSFILYSKIDMWGILCFSSVLLGIAFVMECGIKNKGIGQKDSVSVKQDYVIKTKEGLNLLFADKGLLSIQIFLFLDCLIVGARQVVELPYFINNFSQGEWFYVQIWFASILGRIVGNAMQYRITIPQERRFSTAFLIYISIYLLGGIYLFMPEKIMQGMCFMFGFLGAQAYNIRISSIQSYIEDEKKGRFQSISQFFENSGVVCGQVIVGIMAAGLSERTALSVLMGGALILVVMIIGRNADVKKIYNKSF